MHNLQRTAGYVASSQRQTDGFCQLFFTAAGGPPAASITPLPPGLWFCTLVRLDFGQRMMAARLYQKSNAGTFTVLFRKNTKNEEEKKLVHVIVFRSVITVNSWYFYLVHILHFQEIQLCLDHQYTNDHQKLRLHL